MSEEYTDLDKEEDVLRKMVIGSRERNKELQYMYVLINLHKCMR